MHDVNILDHLAPEAGAFYVMDRGYVDFKRLAKLDDAGSFAKSNMKAKRRYSRPVDRTTGLICDQTIVLTGFYTRQGFDRPLRRFCAARSDDCQALQIQVAGRVVLQMDQAAPADQGLPWYIRERGQGANLVGGLRPCAGRHRQKSPRRQSQPLRNATDFEPHSFRENPAFTPLFRHPSTDALGGHE